MRIQPKNWGEFQHYKDRVPPWIKLHRKILDDYEFHLLPIESKALAPYLWLLASEYEEGVIDSSIEKITFRLRMTADQFLSALAGLESAGFFVVYHDASTPIATGKQDAPLEEERREEIEAEREKEKEGKPLAESDESLPAVELMLIPEIIPPDDPIVVSIILVDKTEFPVTEKMVIEFEGCYPAVNVVQELRQMRAWSLSNPRERKTRSGVMRFVNGWLQKSQNKGGGAQGAAQGKMQRTLDAGREFLRMTEGGS